MIRRLSFSVCVHRGDVRELLSRRPAPEPWHPTCTAEPCRSDLAAGGLPMLWTIVVVLLILWLLGFTLHVAGGLIHILLVIALVVIVLRLLTGSRV
jgi:hypothetical protein